MRQITAVIKPFELDEVREALQVQRVAPVPPPSSLPSPSAEQIARSLAGARDIASS